MEALDTDRNKTEGNDTLFMYIYFPTLCIN